MKNLILFFLAIMLINCGWDEGFDFHNDRDFYNEDTIAYKIISESRLDVKGNKILLRGQFEGENIESFLPGKVSWFSSNDNIEFDSFLRRSGDTMFSEARLILDGVAKSYEFGLCLERNNVTRCFPSEEILNTVTSWPETVVVYPNTTSFSHKDGERSIDLNLHYSAQNAGISSDISVQPVLFYKESEEKVASSLAYVTPLEITLPSDNSDSVNFKFNYVGDSLSLAVDKEEMTIEFRMENGVGDMKEDFEIEKVLINYKK